VIFGGVSLVSPTLTAAGAPLRFPNGLAGVLVATVPTNSRLGVGVHDAYTLSTLIDAIEKIEFGAIALVGVGNGAPFWTVNKFSVSSWFALLKLVD
jgi:hypothetical protein